MSFFLFLFSLSIMRICSRVAQTCFRFYRFFQSSLSRVRGRWKEGGGLVANSIAKFFLPSTCQLSQVFGACFRSGPAPPSAVYLTLACVSSVPFWASRSGGVEGGVVEGVLVLMFVSIQLRRLHGRFLFCESFNLLRFLYACMRCPS